jgi:hypothetical protein
MAVAVLSFTLATTIALIPVALAYWQSAHTETGVKMRAQKAPSGGHYHEAVWPYGKGPITE